jgi:hypothetical protein
LTTPNYQTPVTTTDKKRKLKVYGLPILAGLLVFLLGLFIGMAINSDDNDNRRGPGFERDNRPGTSHNEQTRPNGPGEERQSRNQDETPQSNQEEGDSQKQVPETSVSPEPKV